MNSSDIIIRLDSTFGKNRLTLSRLSTFLDLKNEVEKRLNVAPNTYVLEIDKMPIKEKDNVKLINMRQIKDGIEIKVLLSKKVEMPASPLKIKSEDHVLGIKCNHPPKAMCINCIGIEKKSEQKNEVGAPSVSKCSHGPGGKCINCLGEDFSKSQSKNIEKKWLCQHGPNGKCTHCLNSDKLQDVKHMSFDDFLAQKKANCTNHLPEAKCNNCIPPSAISYKMNLSCTNHLPFPKAMCNKCMPPACIVKRQEYRHVDYAEFMNFKEVNNFVNEWVQSSFLIQKFGFLYGYYAEDPNYVGGVRAIIEAIYQPPQKGDIGGWEELFDPEERAVDMVAEGLGLEKIGWIFTDMNHDAFLDSKNLRRAARYQELHKVQHQSGCSVSKFITVVVRTRKENNEEVAPEVFMVSDQAQSLERDNVFAESDRRRIMKIREPENLNDILPTIVAQGKPSKEIEPEFFIVNVASGHSKNSNYAILKHAEFPVENRKKIQTIADLRAYLNKFSKEPSYLKYSDFHLLIYLSKILDSMTAAYVASCVTEEKNVDGTTEMLIKQRCN